MRRYGLRDDQWEKIRDILPGREGHVGVTAKDNRLFVEAVLYRYRAGIPWRDLPERFGDPIKIHTRFSRWAKSGVWKRIFEMLAADADNELYKARHLMENFSCKLKQYLAIATRYDKTARNFLASIHLAAAVIWLN